MYQKTQGYARSIMGIKQWTSRGMKGNEVRPKLCFVVVLIGEVKLEFGKVDVGLHSMLSRGAIAMLLTGISEIIIQQVGHWSSDAFLEYIEYSSMRSIIT